MSCIVRLVSVLVVLRALCGGPANAQNAAGKVEVLKTKTGVRFGIWGEAASRPAPTLIILGSTIEATLGDAYFRQCGNTLSRHGYLCVSIDIPCHGEQARSKEPGGLEGWRRRCEQNEDFVAENNERLSKVLDHLIGVGYTDATRIAICGTSRGGFLALHFAAHDARVKCVAAYAPVIDLTALSEFRGAETNKTVTALALTRQAHKLAQRASWIIIGDRDDRVGTDHSIALARRITAEALAKKLAGHVELHVVTEPQGHTTPAGAAEKSAQWMLGQFAAKRSPVLDSLVRDISSRRELFIDRFLIERMVDTQLKLHEPRPAAATTEPADHLEYGTVIRDGDIFRLYTRDGRGAKFDGAEPEVTRYCESRDGIHWIKPKLGLHEIDGTKANNVILHEAPFCHNFSPFLDTRPGAPADQRFKALAGTLKSGLVAFASRDGIHWKKLRPTPVITYTREYAFDSQNVSFWSESEQCYVCYFRHFLDKRVRSVCRTTSPDFLKWSEPVPLKPNFAGEHLYTTLTHPYFRAPHIYVALPTRFHPQRGESTDILFMTARGDSPYDRTFREAFITPGLDPARWGNRSNYAALNVVPTSSTEMSIYATPFRRFVLRTDGFASVHAGADAGEMVTRPLRFTGKELIINYATSAGGSVRVEIQSADGKALPGFALADCRTLIGDAIEQPVTWAKGSDVSSLAGQAVRLRFVMQEADLYALQFLR